MMQWSEPKTDWAARRDAEGKYAGDYFNIVDYNRIKNNIEYLGMVAKQFWPVFVRAMPDRNYEEYPYADEINTLADNLEKINAFVGCEIGQKTVYSDNGIFIGYADLNRLESACLSLYEAMQGLYTKPMRMPYRLGAQYHPLKNPKIPPKRTRMPLRLGIRFGGTYYPHEMPCIPHVVTENKKLPMRMGAEYFPFKN